MAQVPSQKSDGTIVRARDQEEQKTIFCTHELSAVMVACTKSMQDEVSQHFSAEGDGVHDPLKNSRGIMDSSWLLRKEKQFSSREWLLVGQSCSGE